LPGKKLKCSLQTDTCVEYYVWVRKAEKCIGNIRNVKNPTRMGKLGSILKWILAEYVVGLWT
jgi:hypothetical protein